MKHVKIDICKDFSLLPFGRYRADGGYSGERFRSELLCPAIKDNDKVTIVLDGVFAYGSSFLDEVFGQISKCGISSEVFINKVTIISEDDFHLGERVWGFIK
jgi:hypothetical protein